MAHVTTRPLVTANSGYVQKRVGLTTTYVLGGTGASNCICGQNWNAIPVKYDSAFFQYDSSVIEDDAEVTFVEWSSVLALAQPSGAPQLEQEDIFIGDIIGAALNGNSGEFNGGTYMTSRNGFTDGEFIDLSELEEDPTIYVSLTGTTDIKVADNSTKGTGSNSWGTNFNAVKTQCQLRITYRRDILKSITETITLNPIIVKEGGKIFINTIGVADFLRRNPKKVFIEVTSIAEVIRKVTHRTLAEAATVLDTITRGYRIIRSEGISIADTLLKVLGKLFNESLTISDQIVKSGRKILLETQTILDTIKVPIKLTISELLTIVDALQRGMARFMSETMNVSDTLVKSAGKSFREVMHIFDTVRLHFNGIFTNLWTRRGKDRDDNWRKQPKDL